MWPDGPGRSQAPPSSFRATWPGSHAQRAHCDWTHLLGINPSVHSGTQAVSACLGWPSSQALKEPRA